MKVSIIIPCYNVQNYISKCLDSVVNQSLNDIEIIVINDGSTDDTLNIIKKYKNIKLIDKKNGGVSAARNDALKIATGEYIAFLDSDDWLDKDALKKAYEKAKTENFDIVAFDTLAIYPDHQLYISSNIRDNENPKNLLVNSYAVIWNKIYKKNLFKNIEFNSNYSFCEDVLFLYMVYSKVKKIGSLNENLHFYLQRPGSLTNKYDKKLYHLIDAMDDVVTYYKKNNIYEDYAEELEYMYIRYLYATFMKRLSKTKNKKEYWIGYNYVLQKVNNLFPNYQKNKYLRGFSAKNFYLKYYNRLFACLIYLKEKNKMN